MARDYGTRRSAQAKNSGPHQLLVVVVTFLLGYLTATVFDIQTLSHWVNTQVLESQQSKQPVKTAQAPQVAPKPKFEFYTLLANEKAGTPQVHPQAATQTQAKVESTPSTASPTQQTTASASAAVAQAATPPAQQIPAKVNVAEGKPLAPSQPSKGAFLVQVASFKARKDAEQMKGILTLKGFDVSVVPVSHAKGNWFRVVIGPFANRQTAQQAQGSIAKSEHLKGMVTPVRG